MISPPSELLPAREHKNSRRLENGHHYLQFACGVRCLGDFSRSGGEHLQQPFGGARQLENGQLTIELGAKGVERNADLRGIGSARMLQQPIPELHNLLRIEPDDLLLQLFYASHRGCRNEYTTLALPADLAPA